MGHGASCCNAGISPPKSVKVNMGSPIVVSPQQFANPLQHPSSFTPCRKLQWDEGNAVAEDGLRSPELSSPFGHRCILPQLDFGYGLQTLMVTGTSPAEIAPNGAQGDDELYQMSEPSPSLVEKRLSAMYFSPPQMDFSPIAEAVENDNPTTNKQVS